MKKRKYNLKKLLISLSPLPILFSMSCGQNTTIKINETIMNKKENGMQNVDINENSFIENINLYANDDSILFYDISFIAVSHKYVPIAHMLRVLQINPNKRIYLFFNKTYYEPDFNQILNSNKFKNLNIIEYSTSEMISDVNNGSFYYGYEGIAEYKQVIKNNNIDPSKIVFFSNEYYFLNRLYGYVNNKKVEVDSFIQDYLLFYSFRELNMIADGTASTKFFDNDFFNYFLKNQDYFKFDEDKNIYPLAIKFMNYFSKLNEQEKINFIKYNEEMDITQIFFYLFTASHNNNDKNTFTKTTFYIPTLLLVEDVNNESSTNLSNNDQYNLFFNPYETKNLNFISLLSGLDKEHRNLFLKTINLEETTINSLDSYETLFNNSYNVVYSGSKISNNPEALNQQAKTLISIYKENYDYKDNIKIWFKGHPRETKGYQDILRNEIQLQGYPELANNIYFLNEVIPMEIFVSQDFLKSDPIKNRIVKFYSSYSTICLYMYSNNQQNDLKRVIVSKEQISDINKRFGNSEYSKIFNSNILISLEEFQNMYDFVTTINENKNYLISSNGTNLISWTTFSNYEQWPSYSYLNFKIKIKTNNKTYDFDWNNNISKYDGGIEILDNSLFNEMILENELKEYNIDNYSKDLEMQKIFKFNINLQKENRFYFKSNVEIFYKKRNKWLLFTNQSPFIIFVDK